MSVTASIEQLQAEAGRLLVFDAPLILPQSLLDLVEQETPHLEAAGYELGLLGWDMPRYYEDYEFARYLPEAWPFALDGGGGFLCLDTVRAPGRERADARSAPVIWAHAGVLDREEIEAVAADFDTLLARRS